VPGVPSFDAQRSVDGERGIEILRTVPIRSDGLALEVRTKCIGVYDKGGAMILEAGSQLIDTRLEMYTLRSVRLLSVLVKVDMEVHERHRSEQSQCQIEHQIQFMYSKHIQSWLTYTD
jgi:hypothetical protein